MSKNASDHSTHRMDNDGVIEHLPRQRPTAEASVGTSHSIPKTPIRTQVPNNSEKSQRVDDVERARRLEQQDVVHNGQGQTYHGTLLLWLSFQSVGVIYGDIGTSLLYVFSSTFSSHPSWLDLVGALSIIIWSLVLIVALKYCFIVLAANDAGHGGTFALYSLLARSMNIMQQDPHDRWRATEASRNKTDKTKPSGQRLRAFLESSSRAKFVLQIIGAIGVSLIIADGILTPAQSVLGAVQGIHVVSPDLGQPALIGITCGILVMLFLIQPYGTSKVGTAFAPIVTIWLLFNLGSGIYNLAMYDHTVLKAFSPYFAFSYLRRNGCNGWKSLSGLLLAFTGVEAMFANLGAFSKRAVQISWLGLVFPCLIFAYIGQAAYISMDTTGNAYSNPFFYTVPPGTLSFSLVIAVLAAVVASQALITSTFQLLSQVMRLSYFPRVKTVHTSKRFHYHIYIPAANWMLMVCTVAVTVIFTNTTSLGNAYGVCCISVALISTFMVTLVAILIWQIPVYFVLPVFLIYFAIDATFTSAVLIKIPQGAWLTLAIAFLLSSALVLWRLGKEEQWAAEPSERLQTASLLTPHSGSPYYYLARRWGGAKIGTVPGLGVFFAKSGDPGLVPISFSQFLVKFAARPRVVVFLHVRSLPVPSVDPADRYIVARADPAVAVGPHGYRVVLRHGYADAHEVLRPGLDQQLAALVERTLSGADAGSLAELRVLRAAVATQTVYIVGKGTLRPKPPSKQQVGFRLWLRSIRLTIFLGMRNNSRAKLADMDLDADKIVEVGFVTDL